MDRRVEDSWSPSYETGITVVDEQHRELFRRIDALTLALYQGRARGELEELVRHLESYINDHFETEERLMRASTYPSYAQHVALHRGFEMTFETIRADVAKHGAGTYVAIRVEREIRKWWENHILAKDREYIPFIPRDAGGTP